MMLLPAVLTATLAARPALPVIGDYNAELRGADGRVDCDLLVRQLKSLGANTYYWLIWHAPTDWEDLQHFLPIARRAGIDVWVYLVPPSEPPPSKPFGLDFVRWGQEIARLSLKHANLKGWVIDDFYANRTVLTPDYIAKVQKAAKAINPKLAFYPLMYFREITNIFTEAYAPVIDGVVVAYPRDRQDIVAAARILRDQEPTPPRCRMRFPGDTKSKPGDYAEISRTLRVVPGAQRYRADFRWHDTYAGSTAGYHFLQFLVDGKALWEADVAGGTTAWQQASVDLSKAVAGKKQVTVALRCYDKKGVSNFGVDVEWAALRLAGLKPADIDLGTAAGWRVSAAGAWEISWHPAAGTGRFRLPFIVMPAGSPSQFRKRHPGKKGTPEDVAAQIRMTMKCIADGHCDGVVIYCLPKKPGNLYLAAVKTVIEKMKPKLTGKVPRTADR